MSFSDIMPIYTYHYSYMITSIRPQQVHDGVVRLPFKVIDEDTYERLKINIGKTNNSNLTICSLTLLDTNHG